MAQRRGFKWDAANSLLKIFVNGTKVKTLGATAPERIGPVTRVDVDAQNATMPVSTIQSGLLVHTSVTGAGTLTVSTGALLDAGFPDAEVGDVISCFYLNDGTQTVTLTGDTGSTALSAQTIATLQGRKIRFLKTGSAAWSVWAD